MDFIELIIAGGWGALAAALTAIGVIYTIFSRRCDKFEQQLDNAKDRERIWLMLEDKKTAFQRYQTVLKTFGERADHWFGPAISLRAFERCLIFAFVYPIVLFILAWVAGMPAKPALPDLAVWNRITFLVFLLLISVGLSLYVKSNGPMKIAERIWQSIFNHRPKVHERSHQIVQHIRHILLGAVGSIVIFGPMLGISSVIITGIIVAMGVANQAIYVAGIFALVFAFTTAGIDIIAALTIVVFYLVLPIVNALTDYCSWGFTRFLLAKVDHSEESMLGFARVLAAVLADLVFAVLCLLGLAAVAAFTLEAFNLVVAYFGWPEFDWRSQISLARAYPFTLGLFVTGMLLTTLLPTIIHLTLGLGYAFTAYYPSSKEKAALISDDMSTSEKQNVARYLVS